MENMISRLMTRWFAAAALVMALGLSANAQKLLLKSGAIEPKSIPAAKLAQIDKVQPLVSGERRVVLVQWSDTIDEARLKALEAQGAQLIQPIPEQGYLVSLPAAATLSLKTADGPSWSSAMDPTWKIHPAIAKELAANSVPTLSESGATAKQAIKRYNIQVVKSGGESAVQKTLATRGLGRKTFGVMGQVEIWTVEADGTMLQDLSRMNSVIWIEPYREPRLMSEREGIALSGAFNGNYSDIVAAGAYQQWLAKTGITGSGVTVHVMDDGLSKGVYSNAAGTAHPDILGRIVGIDNATGDDVGDSGGGHGHLNASIIMGQPIAGGGMTDKDGYKLGQGVAPNARVFATKIFNNSEYFDMSNGFDHFVARAYSAGARISSNSWGADAMGEYDSQAQLFDALTRDAVSGTAGLQAMTFVFSASNAGPDRKTIGTPATAKNVISVGANENSDEGVTDRSGMGASDSNDMRDVASFSSRGPMADGRYGPTVTALGTHVPGAASDSKNFTGNGVSGRAAVEAGEPETNVRYYPAFQNFYTWSSGTSHSCPGVAGSAALFYEYYSKKYSTAPSPALVKAALIAGAIDPVGGNNNRDGGKIGFVPNNEVGWGFATLKGIVDGGNQLFIRDQVTVLRTNGQVYTHEIQVPDSTKPLRIVVAWSDAPGFAGAEKALVNDLDLTVSDGITTWKGNVFAGGHSVEGGDADRLNNVECVFIPRPSPSIYTITVTATNLSGDAMPKTGAAIEQDFALLVTNGADQSPVGRVSFDKRVYSCSDPISVSVSDSDLRGKGRTSVVVTSRLTGDSETFTLNEVEAPSGIMRATLTCNNGTAVQNNGVLSIVNGDTMTARYNDATLGGDGKPLVATVTATLDCTAPALSDVFVKPITDDTATINVKAAEAAQMTIIYGPAGNESQYQISGTSNDISQSFTLTNLIPQTPYFYKVKLVDLAGNTATASDIGDVYFAFQTRSRVVGFGDDMESGGGAWTHSARVGSDDWQVVSSPYAKSAGKVWRVSDPSARKDASLFSPSIALPAGKARLEFWHTFEFEQAGLTSGYDGSVLEISKDNGTTWSDLGGLIVEGGYNSRISSYFGNPLAGRQAWSGGTLGTMHRVLVNLDTYAGKTVKLRWRIGCDSSFGGEGWLIDNASVYTMGDTTTNLALLRFDTQGVTNTIEPLRFTIRDQQFLSSDDGSSPSEFNISVAGRGAPIAINPDGLTWINDEMDIWEGYISVAAAANGHVLVAGVLDVGPGETVRLGYFDYNARNGEGAYARDEITFDCQGPSLVSIAVTAQSDTSAKYHLVASEACTMKANYGISATALNSVKQSTALSTAHDIEFDNLLACTPYYFTIELTDEAGNKSVIRNMGQAFGFRTSQQSVSFDDLEPSPNGTWTHSAAQGSDDWKYTIISTSWNYPQRSYVHSASNAWSCQDVNGLKDARLVMPPVNITTMMKLSFWHTFQTEKKFDGGVIEISTDGGTTWRDLGPDITQGRYNETISGSYGSAIGYRSAWSGGTFGAMTQVIVDLGKYAGSNRLIRFRFVCDQQYGGGGWMIDDVGLITYTTCGTQFPPAPAISAPANNAKGVAFSGTQLRWAAISGATSYEVYFGTSADSLALLGTPTTNQFVITPQVLKSGRTYYWAVRAFNAVGAGNVCATSAFKTATLDPAAVARQIIGVPPGLLTSEKKAIDYNDDGQITIDELVTNVNLSK